MRRCDLDIHSVPKVRCGWERRRRADCGLRFARHSIAGSHIHYHNRASPKLVHSPLIFTRLNLLEVKPGVTHDCCTSGTATPAVSSTRQESQVSSIFLISQDSPR